MPLLFAYGVNRFFHGMAQLFSKENNTTFIKLVGSVLLLQLI